MTLSPTTCRTGWSSWWTRLGLAALTVEAITGLLVTFAPFHGVVQWGLLLHTALGLAVLVPITVYLVIHWLDYRRYNLSDAVLLGYAAGVALLVCAVSGLVVTWQGLFAVRMSAGWRTAHLWSTWAILATVGAHVALVLWRSKREKVARPAWQATAWAAAVTVAGLLLALGLARVYSGVTYVNEFPADYSFLYGEDRPFAPSLALTTTGGAFDDESLANSRSCGTAGCHSQIFAEWEPSAHRYAAMDPLFQKVQSVMAEQNGPESTRYCGGCHDPISLFSGTKNLFTEDLTALRGYDEGVSCLSCHAIRETDLQGNANYVMSQPATYLWQWQTEGAGKLASDFLIRTYPDEHRKLSKRMYKAPEYCAACHKQFIDQEVNRVGWVQLQNQYDNWKSSHWFVEDDPARTVECRECHMPLVASRDPARGDATDYNRTPDDGKHRSHRFLGANSLVPKLLELPGWEEQVRGTEEWLQGTFDIPEIRDKWRDGPVVAMALEVPEQVAAGDRLPVRVVLTANKVGHDFPTGPLDIIQSWVELHVVDAAGNRVFSSGTRDAGHFIEPGSFLFKAEPVDQHGNLIDRHNLWEMVGVRYRRALFPGYSDTVEYLADCPATLAPESAVAWDGKGQHVQQIDVPPAEPGSYRIEAALMYRKVDQFLINFLLGEDSGLTAPVIEMTRATAAVRVSGAEKVAAEPTAAATRTGG
ncbi:MAG TPA: cytochrome b/b6 domain-containing protein [Thermoanaerobaculia bacterium]|nr:cytochrome b/b6 domain-containing protein [Thermoanaerobaculia bacterium]